MTATVIRGDAAHLPLPDASVDLIVTSPPYWSLRSYTDTPELCARCRELTGQGWQYPRASDESRDLRQAWPDWDAHVKAEHKAAHYDGQIGAEATPAAYVDSLIECTREWMRVLKPTGSMWVNLGDKYAQTQEISRHGKGGNLDSTGHARQGYDRPEYLHGARPRRNNGVPTKSLIGLPWRYAIRCIDELGLILRAEVIWSKPNGLPESVTDRVRRSHEVWFHFTLQPRYFAAVDAIREAQVRPQESLRQNYVTRVRGDEGRGQRDVSSNPLGKLPGSVWTIATQPLTVPAELGVDHFAAFPMEWPRRIVQGWSPSGGRVVDPFGGTGTTALVASALGRHGISFDMSWDYTRLAAWRTTDPGQLAAALQVEKPAVQHTGQSSLLDLLTVGTEGDAA